jgi:hypothetical protein
MDNRAVWSEQQQKLPRKRVLVISLVAMLCLGAMSRFEFFGEYFSALWFHWIALMSGAVSVAITFWEKIHNSIGKYVLYTVAGGRATHAATTPGADGLCANFGDECGAAYGA